MFPNEPPIAGDPTDQSIDRTDVRRALDGLAVRAQAVGVLMSEFGITADAAAHRLSSRAVDEGLPIDTIAHEVMAPYAALDDGPPVIGQSD
jgi:AmiR/NasT family two-component response regulator